MSWKKEIETTEFRQAVMAEWIGTFMFLFATIGCVVFTQDGGITTARQLEVRRSACVGRVVAACSTVRFLMLAGVIGVWRHDHHSCIHFWRHLWCQHQPCRSVCSKEKLANVA